jgi:coenzyme F420-reducing hydrogenase beta subunit
MKCKKCGACCRVWGIVEVTNADKMAREQDRKTRRET